MTTFNDYISDIYIYSVPKIEEEFSTWHENISRKDFAGHFSEYLKTLSTTELSRIAEIIFDNQ